MLTPLPCLPLFVMSRVLEAVTWASKGRISFGKFTPACLETAAMEFSADTKKARERLNYTPCWTLDEAVQQTVAEWENRPDAKAAYDLTSPRASPDGADQSPVRTPSPNSDGLTSEGHSVVTPAPILDL